MKRVMRVAVTIGAACAACGDDPESSSYTDGGTLVRGDAAAIWLDAGRSTMDASVRTAIDAGSSTPSFVDASAHYDGASGTDGAAVSYDASAPPPPDPLCSALGKGAGPSGYVCDFRRIHRDGCQPVQAGDYCDALGFTLPPGFAPADAPVGFACAGDGGALRCNWLGGGFGLGGYGGFVDDDALEASCEVTRRFPNAIVECAQSY